MRNIQEPMSKKTTTAYVRAAVIALAFGLAVDGRGANALELTVTEAGGPSIAILDNGLLDDNPIPEVITVDTLRLNQHLLFFSFTDLSAVSNLPGGTSGSISQTGTAQLLFAGSSQSITIDASDVNYTLPSGTSGLLSSSISNTFTHTTVGDSFRAGS
jgi:hypothetical protein